MQKIHSILRILLIALTLGPWSYVKGLPNLVSVKKGIEGEKSWVVLSFDDSVKWVGVQQSSDGNLALIFYGNAGSNDGMDMILDSETGINVNIKQSRQKQSLFMASIRCESSIPLAVLERENTLVMGFNDDRLISNPYPRDIIATDLPHSLMDVRKEQNGEKTTINLAFDRSVNIGGLIRTSKNTIQLLFKNTSNWSGQDEYLYSSGGLERVSLNSVNGGIPFLWTVAELIPDTPISILKEKQGYSIRTSGKAGTNADMASSIIPAEKSALIGESVFNNDTVIPETLPVENSQNKPIYNVPGENSLTPIEESGATGETTGIPWEQRVSFEFSATPIVDALRLMAVSNGLNMVIGDGVEGIITMNLQNVTLREAIEKILYTKNCEYVVEGNILIVKPAKIEYVGGRITKVYRLHYADAENVSKIIKTIASADSVVQVFYPEFLNFTESGKNRIEASKVGVQGIRRASMLVVNDRPEKIREIDRVISELDCPPVQFFIESKLVEMAPNTSQELGVDWENTFGLAYEKTPPSADGETSVTEKTFSLANINDSGTGPFSIEKTWRLGHLSAAQYVATLDFINKQTDSKLISNPRILAMDDEESSISVGTTVPIPILQRGGAGKEDMISFEYKEINIQLNVNPHLGKNNQIIMYVNPVIEEITEWVTYGTQRAPVTAKRSVNSIITVKSGETVVIGGLIKNQKTLVTKRVWLLGSLPLIGPLFQHKSNDDKQTDLMIFITPSIIQD